MPEVNIEINGRKYRMACEDGQEERLQSLGARLNEHVERFHAEAGEVGDNSLVVMSAIAVVDDLVEAEGQIEALKTELAALADAGQKLAEAHDALERRFAERMSEAARRVEEAAGAVEAVNQDGETA